MKKRIIFIITLIIFLLIGIFIFIDKSNSNFNFYTKTFKINELSENSYIEIDNLRISLRKICLNEMTANDLKDLNLEDVTINNIIKNYGHEKINLFLQIETIDKTPYFESSFAYQILDNNNNSLIKNYNFDHKFAKKLEKTLIKRENLKNTNNFFENRLHTNGGHSKWLVQDDLNSSLWNINAFTSLESTEDAQLDLSKLKIFISNVKYINSNKETITSNNNIC